jgi:hypothetical protein
VISDGEEFASRINKLLAEDISFDCGFAWVQERADKFTQTLTHYIEEIING